ncbi:MAG TPA: MFS transporter [Zoogloea sp.]|uniref:MFS transporter n=1 Tax=Zoogloea sp. TaxID=49181 RepID=UPI002BCA0DC0|nr:MFS transporter [Zoogloea sp.]HMV18466.1 MFS transporter [Rhodocyclaceae bacterium]HMV64248.1 MFS transporter [Rhodocyclaceae bacterium]HMW51518.1 MFS transporter [Rhodocyclaceae bacterium]HMY49501.1 MFS transporter [Rhodocyclaceae bacterium]HNC80569.1 MFS transporter [Rhodocyclaceae bacterium]
MLTALRTLPSTVWLLGLVSFFNDTAGELVYPVLPLYLASVLMAGPRALGLIEGIAEATGSLLKLVSGVLSDRLRHTKRWVVAGYAIAGLSRPLLTLATSWPLVLALRFADRIGKGLRSSPRDALLAATVAPQHRGLAFGLHRACDNVGSVAGPLLAAALLARQVPLERIFLWASLGGAVAVALTLLIREPVRVASRPALRPGWTLATLPPAFRRYLAVLVLFTLGNASNMFLLLKSRDAGVADYQVPLLWALVSFTAALFSTPLSALSDRIGRSRLILAGWSVYALFYLLLGLAGQAWMMWPLFAFYGLFMAATEGVEKALVADLVPQEQLGTAFGWFNLAAGLTLLPASLIFGALWDALAPTAAFAFSAACAALAALLLRLWVHPERP